MDDDWDDGGVSSAPSGGFGASDGGTKFSAGRGFKAAESNNNGDWGSSSGGDGGWGNQGDSRSGRGGRGRGGRGGRGGGGYRNRDNENGFDDANENGGGGSWGDSGNSFGGGGGFGDDDGGFGGGEGGRGRGRGRGRGGRGGRGGGRGGRDGDGGGGGFGDSDSKPFGEDGDADQKPREIYVPPDRITDEDLFTTTISSGVNFMKLDDIEVKVSGEDIPVPINTFESSGLRQHLLDNIKRSGYTKPTPIQKYAMPIVLAGRDLMGCAQTGSGKTAAFLLPMINKLIASQEPPVTDGTTASPKVIIVSPTRELAIQIDEQAKKFAYNSIVKTVVAYGGTSVQHQRDRVLAGCHILTATPGRLNDFVTRGHVSFSCVEFFVLDEADRMLDMGFLPTVEQMLGHATMTATGDRQTLMFSATFPEEIQHLAGKFLNNYVFVAVGIVGSASTDVEQRFYQVSKFDKRTKLIELLKDGGGNERTVVFVETKKNADFLASFLCENDVQSTSIHGDRLQREREQALWDFKKGTRNILVATGVAARGLDIEGIQHVINYDLPKSIDEYVHRIGRTGRVGNRGKATSFFDSSQDQALAGSLSKILEQAKQDVPDWLSSGGYGQGGSGDAFGGRDIRGDDFGKAQDFTSQPAEQADDDW